MPDWIGYRWLAAHYGLEPAQGFRTESAIAKRRADGIKAVLEGPDSDLDRIIRSVRQHGPTLSGRLVKEFPALADDAVAAAVVAAVQGAFSEGRVGEGS